MKIISACTSYWNGQTEFDARYNGIWVNRVDLMTGNVAYTLHPEYKGRFGLRNWASEMHRLFNPIETIISCGSFSDSDCNRFGKMVRVLNAGVYPDRPHTNGWQYMGCAMTALMAYVCNRQDWDVLIFLEPDYLLGAVDWDALLHEFLNRSEEVLGPKWFDRHCDFIAWKPQGAARYLHQRLRPNLTTDESAMWLDDELHQMFLGRAWNPWPSVRSTRRDFFHTESQWEGCPDDAEAMTWPIVRMPNPEMIESYKSTQSVLAKPLSRD